MKMQRIDELILKFKMRGGKIEKLPAKNKIPLPRNLVFRSDKKQHYKIAVVA